MPRMRTVCIGGGPAGLYLALLLKKEDPAQRVTVYERNRPDDTFGFGVVFSDQTLQVLRSGDAATYDEIVDSFAHWDDIEIHDQNQVLRSTGHGFSGLSRQRLLDILQRRCREHGVELIFQHDLDAAQISAQLEADLVIGCDGVNSLVRSQYAASFRPHIDLRPNRFVWLGTSFPFSAFTFYFKQNQHGLFRVHAYRYTQTNPRDPEAPQSTFIVECTEETFRRTGLHPQDEAGTLAYCEALFSDELAGHRLIGNRSFWRNFPTIRCESWVHENLVLLGDAAHTAHFSIGSGTKLAMEDAIVLRDALRQMPGTDRQNIATALRAYDAARRPMVESLQRAAQTSLEWFEQTERYMSLPPWQFAFSLLTRSLRVTHENLTLRDPALMSTVDAAVMAQARAQVAKAKAPIQADPMHAIGPGGSKPTPPMFTPFRLRDLVLSNRVVVSPMCQYSAQDGTVDDWHLVHLGSRAIGGAGLVIAEMTDVSAEGRISPGCAGLYRPEHVPAWRRIVEFVHRHSQAKIGVQLGHAGRKGATRLLWEGDSEPLPDGQTWPIVAPSALPYFPHSQVPHVLDRADMDRIRADYVRSAEMAHEAGFDLLEVHMAHGYLLASFISPLCNHRSDEYGGSIENRMRFPLEVLSAVRAVWPAEKPISVRISATDWHPGGISPNETLSVARLLKAAGVDLLDVSTGQTAPDCKPVYGRLYQTPFAERLRLEVGLATLAVGNISSYSDVNSIIAAGRADLAALARAHLFDPYWTQHAAAEQDYPTYWPPQYASVHRYRARFK